MKRSVLFALLLFSLFTANNSYAQFSNGFNVNDPDVVFNSTYQPAAPAWNNYAVVKWGHSNRLAWNPFSVGYKSYIYQGMAFRIKFPKSYQQGVNDGKRYPILIFFHGRGEAGSIYDNEYQLLHGGQSHASKVDDGTFDGFLFYAQSTSGNSQDYFPRISTLIDTMVARIKVDPDRVIVSGLSAGGQASWDFVSNATYARQVAASIPLCAASTNYPQFFPNFITIPIWTSNGGQDAGPAPFTVTYVVDSFRRMGGNIRQTFYPDLGHGIWNRFWTEPDYFPYLNVPHKANPLVYFQRNEFCPTESVNARLAVQAGFSAYEWQKDGVTIPGATTNEYIATTYGTYRVRFRRTSTSSWSSWSPNPVVIGMKQGTQTPPIQINGMRSNVLPAPDGSTTVPLIVPNTYTSYEWRRVSDDAIVSTTNSFNAPVGQYKVRVTEQFGCSSFFSPVFTVVNAAGTNVPDKISNFGASALSSSTVQLDWNDNPTPLFNETAFEVYRSKTSGSGYVLVDKRGADVITDTDSNLEANTRYYYIIRAINNNGASLLSDEVSVITRSDVNAPSAPRNLRVAATEPSTVTLRWDESTDDVGVVKYDIYVNGVKSFVTNNTNTSYTVTNLNYRQFYAFTVIARDAAGNLSPSSNQITAAPQLGGLNYKYYTGSWSVLPDFNTLSPVKTGNVPNVSLSPANVTTNYGFLWEGYIRIPATGSYLFETYSDEGSKLYIGKYSHTATALVNNDGIHGVQYRSGTINLNAGIYPIAITYFQRSGAADMQIFWTSSAAGITKRTAIPNSAFVDSLPAPTTATISDPSNLLVNAVSFKQINVSWNDNSNNETGFEVYRATQLNGVYNIIGTVAANTTSFIDSVGLLPNTRYWYNVRAINALGTSGFAFNMLGDWSLDNVYSDATGTGNSLLPSGTLTFNATDKIEGTHSINLDGSTAFLDMAFNATSGSFPSNSYRSRTVAMWVKPNTTTTNTATQNKILVELGGSDNGLGLRFNAGALEAGIARANTRNIASLTNVVSNADWRAAGWNHVAAVYDGANLRLFVNGVQKASTALATPTTVVGVSSSGSRVGATNGNNPFNSSGSGTNYGGLIDDINIINEALTAGGLRELMTQTYPADTTFALPAIPAAPGAPSATPLSSTQVSVQWTDNSTNETGFEIQRAVNNTNSYRLVATVNAGSGGMQTFTDNNLFANTNYFYRIRAIGIGGQSAYTNVVTARTLNNRPVITQAAPVSMHFSEQRSVSISATDVDGEQVSMMAQNLPSFATSNGTNGNIVLSFAPSSDADMGTYIIRVIATDGNGGADTTNLSLTINNNYTPQIAPINAININEGTTADFNLVATDIDGNATLNWTLISGPSFASITGTTDGTGNLRLAPNFASAGTYSLEAQVQDGSGGFSTITVIVNVTDVQPNSETIFMSMQYQSAPAPAPWNNVNTTSATNLLNSTGQTTPVSIQFLNTPWNGGDAGQVTGNNSGVYPDAVIKDYFWFGNYGAPETVDVRVSGLVPSNKYNLTLFSSSGWFGVADNGTTVYTIGGVSKSVYAHLNTQSTATFTNVIADASGNITVTLSKGANTQYGMLNAIVLEKPFDDGTAPILPTNLQAQALSNGSVRLTWNDAAYNEDRYLVYRSTSANGTYALLNAGASNANDVSYIDNSVASSTTYFYRIEAISGSLSSGLSNIASVTTGNKIPQLSAIGDVTIRCATSRSVNINPMDDATNILTTTVTGLPSFAIFTPSANGNGVININPTLNDVGVYNNITVTTTDNFGGAVSRSFRILVTDSSIRSTYVNFGVPGGKIAPAPWNNWTVYPFANFPLSNLLDEFGVNTGYGVRLLSQWDSNFEMGMKTGNNSGIFPDDVIESSILAIDNTPVNRVVQLEGLNPAKRYNIAIFSSYNAGPSCRMTVSSGTQSIVYETRYNSNKAVNLNNLTPNSSGQIQFTLLKDAAALYLSLNAIVIQEFNPTSPLIRPYDLFAATVLDTNKISLVWSDRSSNETGFQIYRSTSPNGTYSLITTTGANVTSFVDGTVLPNVKYFYRVRAVNGTTNSNFSNTATAICSNAIVFVNFNANASGNASAPWNNTNGPSVEGATFSNLMDNKLYNSGVELVITKEFNGPGFTGSSTANGIFPVTVMQSNYWTDAGQLSQVKFNGLNTSRKYRIGVFGSAIFMGNSVAVYQCNGKTVFLNSLSNDSKVVYLSDLVPNADGELIVDCRTVTGFPYSFTGAWTVEAYDDNSNFTPVSTSGRGIDAVEYISTPPITQHLPAVNSVTKSSTEEVILNNDVNVFPNPFTSQLNLQFSLAKNANVAINVVDQNGRVVFVKNNIAVVTGKNNYPLDLNGSSLAPGTYMMSIIVNGKVSKTIKLLKAK